MPGRPNRDRLLAPIVLGVAGHIDLPADAHDRLHRAAREVIGHFLREFPDTPILVLSSMAAGADQIVARAAEDLADARVRAIAALPMPRAVFVRSTSFEGRPGGAEARAWLEQWLDDPGHESFVVPFRDFRRDASETRWNDMLVDRDLRHAAYAGAGSYLIRHCHVLIALWDGLGASGKSSGTAEHVYYKQHGTRPSKLTPPDGPSSDVELGPVIVIDAPHGGSADLPQPRPTEWRLPSVAFRRPWEPGRLRLDRGERLVRRFRDSLLGEPGHPPVGATGFEEVLWRYREVWQDTDDFNARLKLDDERRDEKIAAEWQRILRPLPSVAARLERHLEPQVSLRAAAGHLAGEDNKPLERAEVRLFALLFMGAASFHLSGHLFDVSHEGVLRYYPALLVSMFLSLVGALYVVALTWRQRLEDHRIDYRGLAEGLRVRNYWGLVGLRHSVADSYLGHLRGDIAWARRVLQQFTPSPEFWHDARGERAPAEQYSVLHHVKETWLGEQASYYRQKSEECRRAAARLRRWGFGLATVGWFAALLPLAPLLLGRHEEASWVARPWLEPEHAIATGAGLLVILGAIVLAFAERKANEDLARRYSQMFRVFEHAYDDLTETLLAGRCSRTVEEHQGCLERADRIIEAIGREALSEHAHWQVLKRARPFEMMVH